MASSAAKVKRKAEALNRLSELSGLLAERFKVEAPNVRRSNHDPELVQIQQIESINSLLESVLSASAGLASYPSLLEETAPAEPESKAHAPKKAEPKKAAKKKSTRGK